MNLNIDRQHIWHPYTSIHQPDPVFPVRSAEGVHIHLDDGQTLIDGMSSWWCVVHGYNHPTLNKAIVEQTEKMAHIMFGGFTHQPAIALTETLLHITPPDIQHIFFADSGSVSVEVAIKMALQYWQAHGQPEKNRLLSLRQGYHGDTFGAMSACDPITGMHHMFNDVLTQQFFTESPRCRYDSEWDEEYCLDLLQQVEKHRHQLAAIILEPVVQAAGGMNFYSPHFLKRVKDICNDFNILLITDEIATGFGRTGELFGCHHAGITPDIMCIGKALTGGYMTLAATLCTDRVSQGISDSDAGVLMHGPTFMANPLACAVANASVQLLLQSPWKKRIQSIQAQLHMELEKCSSWQHVNDVRVLGAIGVVELKKPVDLTQIQPLFVKAGVWVRPFGKLVYIMPPFIIEANELTQLTDGLKKVIKGLPS